MHFRIHHDLKKYQLSLLKYAYYSSLVLYDVKSNQNLTISYNNIFRFEVNLPNHIWIFEVDHLARRRSFFKTQRIEKFNMKITSRSYTEMEL